MASRLDALVKTLEGFDSVLDVGTDHAYLPIKALQVHPRLHIMASDNKKGPLSQAKKNLEAAGFKDQVGLYLGEGLDVLKEAVDVIVMAGMGGTTIQKMVLDKEDLEVKRLVCHPTNHPKAIRQIAHLKAFKIVDEIFDMDQGVPYTLIILEPGSARYTEKELYYGPVLLQKRPEAYVELLKKEYAFTLGLVDQIPEGIKKDQFIHQSKLLKEVIDDGA
jgi:tRNA (adenine22-N1)-methyltransferase